MEERGKVEPRPDPVSEFEKAERQLMRELPRRIDPAALTPDARARFEEKRRRLYEGLPEYAQGFDAAAHAPDALFERTGVLEIGKPGYGFLRSAEYNYLPSPDDIHVSAEQIKQYGLRFGDTVEAEVRPPRENERFFTLAGVKTVGGKTPEDMEERTPFEYLTPLFPEERLKLETQSQEFSTRVLDLFAPIGKGQRGLIVAQPKVGKTILLQKIANAIALNHPEVTLLVLLVDERPEEVDRHAAQRQGRGHRLDVRPSAGAARGGRGPGAGEGQAPRGGRPGRGDPARLDHPPRPREQSVAAREGPHDVRRPGGGRAPGAEAVLRGRAQRRGRRLAHHHRHGARGHGLAHGPGDLRGVQGHRQHGARARPQPRRPAHLPGRQRVRSGTRREELLIQTTQLSRIYILRKLLSDMEPDKAMQFLLDRMKSTRSNDEFLIVMNS